jgi:hypothetical protein
MFFLRNEMTLRGVLLARRSGYDSAPSRCAEPRIQTMRRLPPDNQPSEKSIWASIAPKAAGLAIGLLLGYLLFPGSSSEPEAAPALTRAPAPASSALTASAAVGR